MNEREKKNVIKGEREGWIIIGSGGGGENSLRSALLVLWCRVIFSYKGEQQGAVKAIISAAAQPSLTATSLSQQNTHTLMHEWGFQGPATLQVPPD